MTGTGNVLNTDNAHFVFAQTMNCHDSGKQRQCFLLLELAMPNLLRTDLVMSNALARVFHVRSSKSMATAFTMDVDGRRYVMEIGNRGHVVFRAKPEIGTTTHAYSVGRFPRMAISRNDIDTR